MSRSLRVYYQPKFINDDSLMPTSELEHNPFNDIIKNAKLKEKQLFVDNAIWQSLSTIEWIGLSLKKLQNELATKANGARDVGISEYINHLARKGSYLNRLQKSIHSLEEVQVSDHKNQSFEEIKATNLALVDALSAKKTEMAGFLADLNTYGDKSDKKIARQMEQSFHFFLAQKQKALNQAFMKATESIDEREKKGYQMPSVGVLPEVLYGLPNDKVKKWQGDEYNQLFVPLASEKDKKNEGKEKSYVISINSSSGMLSPKQDNNLKSQRGLDVQSPSGQTFRLFLSQNRTPRAVLNEAGCMPLLKEDKAKYQQRKAVTMMCMIENVLAKGAIVHVHTKDPYLAKIAFDYLHYLRDEKGLNWFECSINDKDFSSLANVDAVLDEKLLEDNTSSIGYAEEHFKQIKVKLDEENKTENAAWFKDAKTRFQQIKESLTVIEENPIERAVVDGAPQDDNEEIQSRFAI